MIEQYISQFRLNSYGIPKNDRCSHPGCCREGKIRCIYCMMAYCDSHFRDHVCSNYPKLYLSFHKIDRNCTLSGILNDNIFTAHRKLTPQTFPIAFECQT
jgi:hypothetical protein